MMRWWLACAAPVTLCAVALFAGTAGTQEKLPGFALIPAGAFEMGDHHGFVDPKHGGDETPIHVVRLDAFYMGIYDVTTQQYCEFLNSVLAQRSIEIRQGGVYPAGGNDLLCETREMSRTAVSVGTAYDLSSSITRKIIRSFAFAGRARRLIAIG